MSERRLRDEGPGHEELRALIGAGSPTRPIPPDVRDRSARRLARYASAAAMAAALSWVPGAAAGAGLGVAAVLVAWVIPAWIRPEPPPTPPASAPSIVATSVSAAPSSTARERPSPRTIAPSPPPRPAPPASATTAREEEEAAPVGDALAAEVALLDRARGSLAANPGEALALTEAHAARFPTGKLGLEREMVAIDALRRLGRVTEARARGEAMLARTQGGLYEERVKKLLDGMR